MDTVHVGFMCFYMFLGMWVETNVCFYIASSVDEEPRRDYRSRMAEKKLTEHSHRGSRFNSGCNGGVLVALQSTVVGPGFRE